VKAPSTKRNQRRESGIALLIAIFVLLLISVVAISLVVSSGTESALAGNYRSATGVYYASLAGLEEARGRLLAKNPNSFLKTGPPNFLPLPGTQWDIGFVRYVSNPGPGDPNDTRTIYADTEYNSEFVPPYDLANANILTTQSVWNVAPLNALPVPAPLYKWVRINAVSEVSLNRRVAPFDGHVADPAKPIYYDGTRLTITPTPQEVLEITSLAVLPNGSQKILQYLAAPNQSVVLPPFPAAITLLGNNVDYTGPLQNAWSVNGNDTITLGNCAPGPAVWAIGYSNNADASYNHIAGSGAVATGPYKNNYTGQGGSKPNVGYIGGSIPANFQTPSQLDALAQSITQIADVVIPGPATGSSLPSDMSNSNLKTVVVQGDLDLTGWHNQGYGLLLVTGNLTYDPDASWYGIVLLIGQGYMTGARNGSGQFVGGVFLAKTRDLNGNLFPDPNLPSAAGPGYTPPDYRSYGSNIQFDPNMASSGTNAGIYYSSCWINAALPGANYNILSFHEISQ
jgi:hypothetical protein